MNEPARAAASRAVALVISYCFATVLFATRCKLRTPSSTPVVSMPAMLVPIAPSAATPATRTRTRSCTPRASFCCLLDWINSSASSNMLTEAPRVPPLPVALRGEACGLLDSVATFPWPVRDAAAAAAAACALRARFSGRAAGEAGAAAAAAPDASLPSTWPAPAPADQAPARRLERAGERLPLLGDDAGPLGFWFCRRRASAALMRSCSRATAFIRGRAFTAAWR